MDGRRNFRVVGYYPCWEPEQLEKADFQVLTHVNYAFAIPGEDGSLLPLRSPGTAAALVKKAHTAGAKALIVVGGWEYEQALLEHTFVKATETPEKREKLAEAILSLCEAYDFDGVDLDWEYPRAGQASQAQYEALMLSLSRQLHSRGKLLTCAVFSGVDWEGKPLPDLTAQTDRVLRACDFINIMAYDGGEGERHSSCAFALQCARCWLDRGVPGEKLTLGVPFYGRPTWSPYRRLVELCPRAHLQDRVEAEGQTVFYNGMASMEEKTRYALENLGGIMIWELTQDTDIPEKSLLQAIGRTVEQYRP